jgi:hypothetical protein
MTEKLKEKNSTLKDLKIRLKNNNRYTYIEFEEILNTVQDRKAFIFLMDAYDTEREITREVLESLIEKTMEINSDFIDAFEAGMSSSNIDKLLTLFNVKNIKTLIIFAVVVGVIISVATNENVAIRLIDFAGPPKQ